MTSCVGLGDVVEISVYAARRRNLATLFRRVEFAAKAAICPPYVRTCPSCCVKGEMRSPSKRSPEMLLRSLKSPPGATCCMAFPAMYPARV